LLYLVQPFVWLRLAWRARRQGGYLRHLGERYGFFAGRPAEAVVWLHAVSVGETRAAQPLIEALLAARPDSALLLTHMTPTGRAAGAELAAKYGGRLVQAYLPYDLPGACARFLGHFKPRVGLLMETEIWPNLIAAARAREIPVLLVNARLSEKSRAGYRRILPLARPALRSLAAVAAQTPADARRLADIGAPNPRVTGNLKFDVTPDPEKIRLGEEWRSALAGRPVWLAASTREGEEELILDALAGLDAPGALLLLVPRHPQRFDEVAALIERRGLPLVRRSAGRLPAPQTRVWLGDSMGEMPAYFTAADLALIGGTLRPFGGQNLIEAAACGCPALVGPHTYNFAQATEDALAAGAARRVADAVDAARAARALLADRAALEQMRRAAIEFSQAHRGATARTMTVIGEFWEAKQD
jgi:3-deoxy-D-manno-octulosonic-acid transferase